METLTPINSILVLLGFFHHFYVPEKNQKFVLPIH